MSSKQNHGIGARCSVLMKYLHPAILVEQLVPIREPKSMNLEIISKGFLQMTLKKFGS